MYNSPASPFNRILSKGIIARGYNSLAKYFPKADHFGSYIVCTTIISIDAMSMIEVPTWIKSRISFSDLFFLLIPGKMAHVQGKWLVLLGAFYEFAFVLNLALYV